MLPTYQSVSAYDIRAPFYTSLSIMSGPVYQPLPPFTIIINLALHATLGEGTAPPFTSSVGLLILFSQHPAKASNG